VSTYGLGSRGSTAQASSAIKSKTSLEQIMNRITRKQADEMARRLNGMLGLPIETYVLDETSGRYVSQIGCIHIVAQSGTHNIYQIANDAGGCTGLVYGVTLREANDWLNAAMVGIRLDRLTR
jgi:hypothetical protein